VQAKHEQGASKTNHGFEARNNRTPEMHGPWMVEATNRCRDNSQNKTQFRGATLPGRAFHQNVEERIT